MLLHQQYPGNTPTWNITKRKEFLEALFSVQSALKLYNEDLAWKPSLFIKEKPIISSERMLHKDYGHKGSVAKKKETPTAHEPQGVWR
jgi:hypothetical protein